jgi:hypothetical protein
MRTTVIECKDEICKRDLFVVILLLVFLIFGVGEVIVGQHGSLAGSRKLPTALASR